jgi:hypothetical protein
MWLTVSKVVVHGHLTPLLWACGRAEHHSGEQWWSKAAHVMTVRKEKREKTDVIIAILL